MRTVVRLQQVGAEDGSYCEILDQITRSEERIGGAEATMDLN